MGGGRREPCMRRTGAAAQTARMHTGGGGRRSGGAQRAGGAAGCGKLPLRTAPRPGRRPRREHGAWCARGACMARPGGCGAWCARGHVRGSLHPLRPPPTLPPPTPTPSMPTPPTLPPPMPMPPTPTLPTLPPPNADAAPSATSATGGQDAEAFMITGSHLQPYDLYRWSRRRSLW